MTMKYECEVIRDLLPLYADDVCSAGSRKMVEEHLEECAECTKVLEQLRTHEIEEGLKEEKNQVIEYQAKKFRRRSATAGSVVAGLFMIPVLVCLIVNLASGAALGWFFVVLAALAVAASLIVVPLMVPENKLLWTFCAFCASLVLLLFVCSLYSGGSWFLVASSAALFGLGVVFLPFVIRAEPVKQLIGDFNRPLLVIAADVILFANMMNMISVTRKGALSTALMEFLVVACAGLLAYTIITKRGEKK